MSLLSDIFQQNQQITQNPTSVVRTPTQLAYDTLLNREAEINKQNKTNNFVNGLMSGMGGLGKIIASAVVKQPMQQAGATKGISEQEPRLDALQQAYAQAKEQQNKDYVNQAREQLGLAREDEDKDYRRNEADKIFNYNQEKDLRDYDLRKAIADYAQKNADRQYNLQVNALKNKPAELTPEEKIELKVKEENAVAKAKAKREAEQDLNKALAGQQAFQSNLEHIKDLSKNAGNILDRSIGSVAGLFTGKDTALTKANNAMDELVSQLRQAALVASGISGESDDKAQQAKLKDIYERAGVPMNAKSLTQAQVSSIINNIENIYKQRVAEKQNLADSFNNDFSFSWRKK